MQSKHEFFFFLFRNPNVQGGGGGQAGWDKKLLGSPGRGFRVKRIYFLTVPSDHHSCPPNLVAYVTRLNVRDELDERFALQD